MIENISDGGLSSQSNEDPQNSPSDRISQVQAQDFVKVLQMHQIGGPGFDSSQLPGFVHVIS